MYIEMEKALHDLEELLRTKILLRPRQIKCVLKQIAQGLLYLHEEKKILHRDIKPANILWYEGGIIKITDFNHAIEVDKLKECKWKGNCGTYWFKAPEFLLDLRYSEGIDVWALGCIFEFLLTGDFIFQFKITKHEETYKRK